MAVVTVECAFPLDLAVGFFEAVDWVKLFVLPPLLCFDATFDPFESFDVVNASFILLAIIMLCL